MANVLRFPFPYSVPNVSAAETSQIITIASGLAGTIPVGGAQTYTPITAWKISGVNNTATPFPCAVIELRSNTAMVLGDGTTELIGLFGQVNLVQTPTGNTQRVRTLLAILGLNIGAQMPQIPFVQQAAAASDIVGLSQPISNLGVYDALSIGGVLGDVNIPELATLTVVARPIRDRSYLG